MEDRRSIVVLHQGVVDTDSGLPYTRHDAVLGGGGETVMEGE